MALWQLCYGVDSSDTALLEQRALYVVPVVNPDGYAYNESLFTTTHAFGLWRKNLVNIPNATNTTLFIANAQQSDAGQYSAVTSNSAGTYTLVYEQPPPEDSAGPPLRLLEHERVVH